MDPDAYLHRIGARPSPTTDLKTLWHLQERHLATVPFENLAIHLGERVSLEEKDLFAKIVDRRRGGICYEVNGLFAWLLRELGFEVTLLGAKVFRGGSLGPPFDHLALRVDLDEPWLVDVGFGRHSVHPLRLNATEAQQDDAGDFLILDAPGGDIDILRDGEPAYRLERRARELHEFEPTCWWQTTSPGSNFTKRLVCSLLTADRQVTLAGDRLIETVGDDRTERLLSGDAEILATYRTVFGFELERVPVVGQK
jgi:N-hydroxyarylamine O-acetyltransferase